MLGEQHHHTVTVEGSAFRSMLARIAKLGRRGSGKAVLQFKPGGLLVEWGGATEELAGEGGGDVTLGASFDMLKGLSRTLPKSGSVTLTFDGEKLRIGTTSFKCDDVLDRRPPQLLATNSNKFDVLMLHYQENWAKIAEAGLSDEVKAIRERMQKSVEKAANALGWLKVSEEMMESWVEAHLQAVAQGQATFEVEGKRTVLVEREGQVLLFDGGEQRQKKKNKPGDPRPPDSTG